MQSIFIIEALRTPFGSFGGSLADVPAPKLAETVCRELLKRSKLDPVELNQFIAGQVLSSNCGQAPARQAMRGAGLTLEQNDLFEINEAFSAVALLAINQLQLDRDKVNINGGAVSIGHPVGASGGRLVATLLNGLQSTGGRYGLATLCIGGGEAVAAIFERI